MRRLEVRIKVVRVDVERYEIEGVEARRIDDRHVVGRADGGGGNVRSGARTDVRYSVGQDSVSYDVDELQKLPNVLIIFCGQLKASIGQIGR